MTIQFPLVSCYPRRDKSAQFKYPHNMSKLHNGFWPFFLWLSLQAPALRPLYKYAPEGLNPLIPLILLAAYTAYFLLWRWRKLQTCVAGSLDSKYIFFGLIILLAAVAAYVYPIADGLKFSGGGSDQDDAIIAGATALLGGHSPYSATTYFGNPISPGPGWIMLLSPLVSFGLYWLITPLTTLLAAWSLKKATNSWLSANLYVLLLMTSLMFWELTVVGSDLVAIGNLLVALTVWAGTIKKTTPWLTLTVLVGTIATSRVVFAYLPLLMAFAAWPLQRCHRKSSALAAIGFLVCILWHTFFYQVTPASYAPLHLFDKSSALMLPQIKIAFVIVCAIAAFTMWKIKQADLVHRLLVTWLGLFAPLAVVSLGSFLTLGKTTLEGWEGANYLLVPLPLFIAAVSVRLREKTA